MPCQSTHQVNLLYIPHYPSMLTIKQEAVNTNGLTQRGIWI